MAKAKNNKQQKRLRRRDDASSVTCMAGLPVTKELIGLKIPYGKWKPDTIITDTYGNPIFSVLDAKHTAMGSFEAIFGDSNGHKLCYVKRRLIANMLDDGWDFCTYEPNFKNQPKYKERDMHGRSSIYPHSFLSIRPMKCSYKYSVHKEDMKQVGDDVQLEGMNGWLGSITVMLTPLVRFGKWSLELHRPGSGDAEIIIDQSKNLVEAERGNDLLAALCIAYAFDKALCQPIVSIIGYEEKEYVDDDDDDDYNGKVKKDYKYDDEGYDDDDEYYYAYDDNADYHYDSPDGDDSYYKKERRR